MNDELSEYLRAKEPEKAELAGLGGRPSAYRKSMDLRLLRISLKRRGVILRAK